MLLPLLFSEYRSAFSLFDKNGDGRISVSELGEIMTALGKQMTKRQLAEMLSQWDIDGKNLFLRPIPLQKLGNHAYLGFFPFCF